jgi:hypothetical protein
MITEWKNRPEDDLGRRLHVMTSYEGSLIMRGGATYAPTVIMSPGTLHVMFLLMIPHEDHIVMTSSK